MASNRGKMSNIKRIAIVYNQLKPTKHLDKFLSLVQRRDPLLEIDVIPTTDFTSGLRQAKAIQAQGYDLIIAAGGDGTLMSVVNAAVASDTIISILPLGTSNDYAKALGIHSVEDAVEAIFQGVTKAVDTGQCTFADFNGEEEHHLYFCSTAGVGFFARISQLEQHVIGRHLKHILGDAVWLFLAVSSIFSSNNVKTQIQLGTHSIQTDIFLFEISKVIRTGGFLLTPQARVDSGFFDLWLVQEASKASIWSIFFRAVANRAAHLQHPNVQYFTGQPNWNRSEYTKPRHITIVPEEPQPLYLNGEVVGQTPATFQIKPKSLQVLSLAR